MITKTLLLATLLLCWPAILAAPLGTGFTYQGRLSDGDNPANGNFDLRFALFNAESDGSQVGSTITRANVAVVRGVFTTTPDFGAGVLDGTALWLEIGVRPAGGGDFTKLTPRQPLTPAPYALYALTPAGPQGVQGDSGPAGPAGAQGPAGPKGDKGDTGLTGPAGAQGLLGAAGALGPKGDTGLAGPAGPQGPIGPAGPTGATGAIGPVGPQGAEGLVWRGAWSVGTAYALDEAVTHNGSSWMAKLANTGSIPVEGSSNWDLLAEKGDIGATGPEGSAGPQGAQGIAGPAGPQGPKGDSGPAGPAGAQGPAGPKGDKGDTGLTGPAGAQGLVGAAGALGPKGDTGLAGPAGPLGPIGPAGPQGPKGDSGPAGPAGAQGPAGPKGDKGDTGLTGPVGAQGLVGPLGATGTQGPKGDTGLAGPAGPQGPQGLIGPAGPTGDTGAIGPAGRQGREGLVWRGAWSVGTAYLVDDAVSHNGSSWMAKLASTGSTPAEDGTNWDLLAEKGDIGATGPQGAGGPQGAQGVQGPAGSPGPPGAQGSQGLAGPIGLQGPPGPQGVQGVAGPPGATGRQGIQGIQGPQGLPGSADAWSLTGNAGTSAAVNFLGTTDDQPLDFRVNNQTAIRVQSDKSVGFGVTTLDANAFAQFDLPASVSIPHVRIKSSLRNAGFGLQFVNPGERWFVGPNIGNWADNRFNILADSSNKGIIIAANGNVGLGGVAAPSPFATLTVDGTIGFPNVASPMFYIYPSGTANAQKPVIVHSPGFPGYGLFYQDSGDRFVMQSSPSDTTPSLVVDLDSNWVAIATDTPKPGYELSVNGQIVCEDILVEDSADWPDYVFEPDYPLKPLGELEAHIRDHKHLPGLPSAAEVKKDGLALGAMQKRMVEKIEELTLYVIDQNKRLATQDKQIAELRETLHALIAVKGGGQ